MEASPDVSKRFYTQLGEAMSQLRGQEFDYAGSLTKDGQGGYTITSPRSVDLNSVQLQGMRKHIPRQATAFDFAMCHYRNLAQRLSLPSADMEEDDAQHEVFALEDFKVRLFQLLDPSLNFQPFVLSHGDLRPSNIIVSDDLVIEGIIDWEWSGTVPRQFFTPPLWLSGYEASSPRDRRYHFEYSKFYQALSEAGAVSDHCYKLAAEWGSDLCSSYNLFLAPALLHHHVFIEIYYMALFPGFYKGIKREEKLKEFYQSSKIFCEAVRKKVEASAKYKQQLIANGLLNKNKTAEYSQLEELHMKSAQMLATQCPFRNTR